jgi:hypothetical protein
MSDGMRSTQDPEIIRRAVEQQRALEPFRRALETPFGEGEMHCLVCEAGTARYRVYAEGFFCFKCSNPDCFQYGVGNFDDTPDPATLPKPTIRCSTYTSSEEN